MTSAALIVTMLCYIMAMGMALPSKVAVREDLKAESQWHLQAPSRGCVEVSHSVGGSTFRSYACDGANGPCLYSPAVAQCPTSALFTKPDLERVVNIKSRDHLVRYYNQIGGACHFSILPECCAKASTAQYDDCFCISSPDGERICEPEGCDAKSQGEECKCITLPTGERICDPIDCDAKSQGEECKCITLPTGERICDPIDCDAKSQGEECKCITLPTGERICDPIDCEGGWKQTKKLQGNEAVVEALLKYIMQKN